MSAGSNANPRPVSKLGPLQSALPRFREGYGDRATPLLLPDEDGWGAVRIDLISPWVLSNDFKAPIPITAFCQLETVHTVTSDVAPGLQVQRQEIYDREGGWACIPDG